MYSFITGSIVSITPTQVVINNSGIGYEIEISLLTFERIKELEETQLFVQLIVREDSHTLYGFHDETSKLTFNKLISVSGIGPNTGRLILSGMTAGDIVRAIRQDDDSAFKKVKGVGPKTAKRIILDLKGKMMQLEIDDVTATNDTVLTTKGNTATDEALSALIGLGFKRTQAAAAVQKAVAESTGEERVEAIIKLALKTLTGAG